MIVIAEHAGLKTMTCKALCHAAVGMDHDVRNLQDLTYKALGRNLADEEAAEAGGAS